MAEEQEGARFMEIDRFIKKWQAGLEIKQATYIQLAKAALITRDPDTMEQSREAFRDYMQHMAAEGLDPPDGWYLVR